MANGILTRTSTSNHLIQVRWVLNPNGVGTKTTKRQLSRKLSANQRQMETSPAKTLFFVLLTICRTNSTRQLLSFPFLFSTLRKLKKLLLVNVYSISNPHPQHLKFVFFGWNKLRIGSDFKCGGWDLNPRTPTRQGPKPCSFDQTWRPPPTSPLRLENTSSL